MNCFNLNQINRYVLDKQHLIQESQIDNILQITKDICGLHATGAATPYLSLFARTRNFVREDLDKELDDKKTLARIRCMRKTVYILVKEMIPIAHAATCGLVELNAKYYLRYLGITAEEYQKASRLILKVLKGKGMNSREIKEAIKAKSSKSAVINYMCDKGFLIRGIPKGSWKSNAHTYYRFDEFFPDIDLKKTDEKEARRSLIEYYIAAFGPVTETDMVWWTGFTKGQIGEVLKEPQSELTQVGISDIGGSYFMLKSDVGTLQSSRFQRGPVVNLLPWLDPYLMGYKERQRYLEQECYHKVFDRSGNATSTILETGIVVGVWDFAEEEGPVVKLHIFDKVAGDIRQKIYSEAQRIGRFIADKEVGIKECGSMVSLRDRTAGGFMTPLRDC